MSYDYEKENYKTCPVCLKVLDYHVDGIYHDEVLNIWACRNHTLGEILKVIGLRDENLIRFILTDEVSGTVAKFRDAYKRACDAILEMSRIWENPICCDIIQESIGAYPDYFPSFDEFAHDFIGIWPGRG